MSKTVSGVGYILMILGLLVTVGGVLAVSPYALLGGAVIAIIGYLLINIGFITMGRKYNKGAWTATGVIGILVFILYITAIAIIAGAVASAMSAIETAASMEEMMQSIMGPITGALAIVFIAGILAFVWFIMEIIVLWSAAGYFGSGVLKGAAILKIIVLILTLIAIPALAVTAGMSAMGGGPETAVAMGVAAAAVAGLDALLLIISLILAGIGFLTAKEPAPYTAPAYTTQVAPPPPPA